MTGSCNDGNDMKLHTKLYYQAKERDKLDKQNADREKISKIDVPRSAVCGLERTLSARNKKEWQISVNTGMVILIPKNAKKFFVG